MNGFRVHITFFISSLVLTSFYLLIVGVEAIVAFEQSQWPTHTLCRTPLEEGSARRRDLYLTTHNTSKRDTSMPPAGFVPAIPTSERQQNHALDHSTTRIGMRNTDSLNTDHAVGETRLCFGAAFLIMSCTTNTLRSLTNAADPSTGLY
jgi:hypothetical protein